MEYNKNKPLLKKDFLKVLEIVSGKSLTNLQKFFELSNGIGYTDDVYKNFEQTEFHRGKVGGNGVRLIFNTNRNEIRVAKDFFSKNFGYTVTSAGFSFYNLEGLLKCIEDIQEIQ